MDCERFDRDSLALLYGELDELAAGGLRRHLSHCERCQNAWQKMARTREAFHIDLDETPPDLFEQIMAAEREAIEHLSPQQRLGRYVSIIAGYAMRPQLAMAALLLLMVGSSLVFVRGGPGLGDQVAVRETGSPIAESEGARGRAAPLVVATEEALAKPGSGVETSPIVQPEAESARAAKKAEAQAEPVRVVDYAEAMRAYQSGSYAEAERLFSEVAARGGEKAGSAALHEAHAARNGSGCQRAASTYDEVALRFRGTAVGDEASWHAANCYRALGQLERARAHLDLLKNHPAYQAQVERALQAIAGAEPASQVANRAEKDAGPTAPAAASAPSKAKASSAESQLPATPTSPPSVPAAADAASAEAAEQNPPSER